jgi:hypothetical protein
MAAVLNHFKNFVSKEENIYGLQIQRGRVTDTLLVTAKMQTTHYPTPSDYYPLIDELKKYITGNSAQETDFPMLHIEAQNTGLYRIMVAVPVNKKIPDRGAIVAKRMVPGNILTADVKGGMTAVNEGLNKFEHFISDYQFTTPAISFQSLITNRMQEPDTSKWITKLCFPVY